MRPTALAAGLLFASGATGLVYEVAWARELGPMLGHTADAAAVAVAAYFVGLAAGGALGAALARRLRRPLLGYAVAEAIAAAWALAMAPALRLAGGDALAGALHEASPLAAGAARAGVAMAALLPATIALGVTIPLVAAHLRTVRGAAWAYAANLAGAVVGTTTATFVLLGAVGVTATGRIAAAIALAVAAVAAWAGRRPPGPAPAAVPDPSGSRTARLPALALALALVSGAGSAAAQVLYTRALALTFHNSTYTFGAVVTGFLLALAAGTTLAARIDGDGPARRRAAGRAALAAAVLLPGGVITLWATTQGFSYFSTFGELPGYVASAIGLAVIVVGPAVTAMAFLLPLAWRLGGDDAHAGATIGRLTAANNLAGALGSLATALVIAPGLGLWNSVAAVTALYAITGAVVALRGGERRAVVAVAVAVAAATAAIARPVPRLDPGVRLIERRETAYGWLEVTEDARGERRLRQNIHYGFASSDNDLRQRRMGQLPLLLHPRPRRALFFGLATGITAGGALADPGLERLDVVELIPEVEVAARHFARWNGGVLDDPRARIHHGDARFWLAGATGAWDVIVTDLQVPWASQAGYLYAVEHYREVARRLAPGGIFVQWIALWQVGAADLTLIADTTRAVFPTVTLWRGDTSRRWGLIAVVASTGPIALDAGALSARAAHLRPPPRNPDPLPASPRRLVELYVGDWPARPGAPLNRDDTLRLELEAPKSNRRRIALTGDRLVAFYRQVLAPLARTAVQFTPRPGQPAWDPEAGVRLQMGAAGEDGTPPAP